MTTTAQMVDGTQVVADRDNRRYTAERRWRMGQAFDCRPRQSGTEEVPDCRCGLRGGHIPFFAVDGTVSFCWANGRRPIPDGHLLWWDGARHYTDEEYYRHIVEGISRQMAATRARYYSE